uniref:Uncharacterized protein n=1 Tax=Panagrolaimus sp. JU765 TaxID=591449 RepID=A0AC34Q853_9BILA
MSSFPISCNPYHAKNIGMAAIKKETAPESTTSGCSTEKGRNFIPQPLFHRPECNITVSIGFCPNAVKSLMSK